MMTSLMRNQTISSINFPTDYTSILERVQAIDPVKYALTRNFLNGHITYLSPYISRGVISVKKIIDSILSKGYPIHACEKLLQELAWREYYQRVWQTKKDLIWEDLKQPQQAVAHHKMIHAIQNAQTGIDAIDRQIIDFYKTGYLHNHVRMYLAAITCNIGNAHWLQPSKWMYYHLLDGDMASNNCSWQWVAGSFSSKKYYCNQENINKYTFSTQTGTFLDKPYEDLVASPMPSVLKETVMISFETHLPETPLPTIDINLPTLIYNAYNLDPEWRKEEKANRVLLLSPSHFKNYPVSDKVIQFIVALAKNIHGMQIFSGELAEIQLQYGSLFEGNHNQNIISKEHPAFEYPGWKDQRDWMFPQVTGYFPSFFGFWKKCQKSF
jgi:deoxyribodipyrimidine photo-lyase